MAKDCAAATRFEQGDLHEPGLSDRNREFGLICAALRATGGVARSVDLDRLLMDRRPETFSSCAELVRQSEIFGFEWHGILWVPMFQFDLADLSIKSKLAHWIADLAAHHDHWATGVWLALPNPALNDRRPIDVLETNLEAVERASHQLLRRAG